MMGRKIQQGKIILMFNLEERIPEGHILRKVNLGKFYHSTAFHASFSFPGSQFIDPSFKRLPRRVSNCSYCPANTASMLQIVI